MNHTSNCMMNRKSLGLHTVNYTYYNNHIIIPTTFHYTIIPYSRYNLRGAISANHQISHLKVIFTIIKFANHSMVLRGGINLCA